MSAELSRYQFSLPEVRGGAAFDRRGVWGPPPPIVTPPERDRLVAERDAWRTFLDTIFKPQGDER